MAVLANVQGMVEANYINCKPRYHLPSARCQQADPEALAFFIIKYSEYVNLSTQEIQNIFHERHIVVKNVPVKSYKWERESLSMLGSLTQHHEIQGLG